MWQTLQNLRYLLDILQRQDDLNGLMQWAKRKRLSGPGEYYQRLLCDTENSIFRYTVRHPRTVELARWIHCFIKMINPPHYKRGYARKYRFYGI